MSRMGTALASLALAGGAGLAVAGCASGAAVVHDPASHSATPAATHMAVSCQKIDNGARTLLAKAQGITGSSMQAGLKREVYKAEVQALLTTNVQRGCPADPQLQQSLNALS
jgi:hypothetical protein